MKCKVVVLTQLLVTLIALWTPTAVAAVTVNALALPAEFTVKPESETRAVSISSTGVVTARAESTDRTSRTRAFRWSPAGVRLTYEPLNVLSQPDPRYQGRINIENIAAAADVVYVTASTAWSGAYGGVSTEAQQWTATGSSHWRLPKCVAAGDALDAHVYGADESGRVALTMDMTGQGSYLVMRDVRGEYAPYAFIVDGAQCRILGRAIVVDVRGEWSSGYRGYLDGHLAPTNLNVMLQTPVAVRWHGTDLVELGTGDALAVSSSGFAVGADAVPGRFDAGILSSDGIPRAYRSAEPHAVAWDRSGREIMIEHTADRSVAYDVADDGTVVGTLTASDKRHYAFRWRAGKLERLDDLPHRAGWRFESAYSVSADGTIAGIGTYDGIPTVFTWHT